MRQMILVGFLQAQNCTNHPSSWRHPASRTDSWSPDFYRHIGRVLEEGKFHLGFFDDRLSMPDMYGRNHAHTVAHGIRCVKLDAVTVLTVMGMATRAPRPRRNLFDQLLRALPRGAPVRHPRSDDAGSRGVECRHLAQRRRSAEHGPRRGGRARPALRPGRRVHGDRARPLGRLGGRRHRPGQGDRVVRQAREGASPRLPGPLLPLARAVHGAALGAGPSGHHPGRSERPRPAFRRALGRSHLRRLTECRCRPARVRGIQGGSGALRPRARSACT